MGPSWMNIVVILVIVLLLFGGKKIPELAKGLGTGIKNFKNAVKDDEAEVKNIASSEESTQKIQETQKVQETKKVQETQKVQEKKEA